MNTKKENLGVKNVVTAKNYANMVVSWRIVYHVKVLQFVNMVNAKDDVLHVKAQPFANIIRTDRTVLNALVMEFANTIKKSLGVNSVTEPNYVNHPCAKHEELINMMDIVYHVAFINVLIFRYPEISRRKKMMLLDELLTNFRILDGLLIKKFKMAVRYVAQICCWN